MNEYDVRHWPIIAMFGFFAVVMIAFLTVQSRPWYGSCFEARVEWQTSPTGKFVRQGLVCTKRIPYA